MISQSGQQDSPLIDPLQILFNYKLTLSLLLATFAPMLQLGTANRSKLFSKIISMVLIFVFTTITAVQALHKHQTSCIDQDDTGTEYVYSYEKCSICDYLIQKQGHHAHLSYPPVITAPVTKAVTLLTRCYAGVYKFTLQGFTNKGPPAFFC